MLKDNKLAYIWTGFNFFFVYYKICNIFHYFSYLLLVYLENSNNVANKTMLALSKLKCQILYLLGIEKVMNIQDPIVELNI